MTGTTLHDGWRLVAIACLFVIATAHAVNVADPFGMDFVSFYAAGLLTLAGDAPDAWDVARHQAVELTAVAERTIMPFPYPPFFLFAVAPFALLPFGWAALAWTAAGSSRWSRGGACWCRARRGSRSPFRRWWPAA